MSDDPAKPPRFPFVAALLCAACIGLATWTWMRYSYCWTLTRGLPSSFLLGRRFPLDAYVRIEGTPGACDMFGLSPPTDSRRGGVMLVRMGKRVYGDGTVGYTAKVRVFGAGAPPSSELLVLSGRLTDSTIVHGENGADHQADADLNTSLRRFHPASIAGLAVGAMGVFVFAVALRAWLRERRVLA